MGSGVSVELGEGADGRKTPTGQLTDAPASSADAPQAELRRFEHEDFCIGDVVKAMPEGSSIPFEGVLVCVEKDTFLVRGHEDGMAHNSLSFNTSSSAWFGRSLACRLGGPLML